METPSTSGGTGWADGCASIEAIFTIVNRDVNRAGARAYHHWPSGLRRVGRFLEAPCSLRSLNRLAALTIEAIAVGPIADTGGQRRSVSPASSAGWWRLFGRLAKPPCSPSNDKPQVNHFHSRPPVHCRDLNWPVRRSHVFGSQIQALCPFR